MIKPCEVTSEALRRVGLCHFGVMPIQTCSGNSTWLVVLPVMNFLHNLQGAAAGCGQGQGWTTLICMFHHLAQHQQLSQFCPILSAQAELRLFGLTAKQPSQTEPNPVVHNLTPHPAGECKRTEVDPSSQDVFRTLAILN